MNGRGSCVTHGRWLWPSENSPSITAWEALHAECAATRARLQGRQYPGPPPKSRKR